MAFDLLAAITRRSDWRFAARGAFGVAVLGGSAAALAGLWDYQAVPSEHPARQTGAVHGWTNGGGMGLLGTSVALRARIVQRPHPLASAFSFAGLGVLAAGGWLGGEMVFRRGWRVVPAEHAEQLESETCETTASDNASIAPTSRYATTNSSMR